MSLPVFEAAPGMPLHLVRRASTVALPTIDAMRRRAILQPRDPHAFSLRCDDESAIAIGDSRFTVVQLLRGTVSRIFTTAVDDYVGPERALDEATRVMGVLAGGGFNARERTPPAQRETLRASHEQVRVALFGAPFGSGAWRAEVWVRTVMRGASVEAEFLRLRGDQCLVNVLFFDEAVTASHQP